MQAALIIGLALRHIAWESIASRQSREVIAARFGGHARVDQIAIDYDSWPVQVNATVLTPAFQSRAEEVAGRLLTAVLERPVEVTIEQLRVGTAQAEGYQLAAVRAGQRAERRASRVAERLALVAGVSPDAILIDRAGSRAVVRAAPLPGASLSTYRVLESRVGQIEPGWRISLIPPVTPLSPVTFGEAGEPDEAGRRALATAIWGARRLHLPIGVGGSTEQAETILQTLEAAGVEAARIDAATADEGTVPLRWQLPE